MRFVDPGVGTVNEQYLLAALAHHGQLVASGREVAYKRLFTPGDDRFIGDAFGLFTEGGVASLVGIEIKDWAAPVAPKVASEYMATYGRSCDFFYLAARTFMPGVRRLAGIGLIDLTGPKVVRKADRLNPDEAAWRYVTASLREAPAARPMHPRQRTFE